MQAGTPDAHTARCKRPRAAGILFCAALPTAAAAQDASPAPPPSDKALRPGAIGLALLRPAAEAMGTVKAGLSDSRAPVRAAAARAAFVMGLSAVASDVGRALGAETDVDAAVEEVRALALLGGPEADAALLEAAARLRPSLAYDVADALARTRRGAALSFIPRLRPLGLEWPGEMVRIASAGHPETLVPAASVAVGAGDAETWRALLQAAIETRYAMPEGLLTAALSSRAAAVRQATYEHVAEVSAHTPPSEAVRTALAAAPEKSDPAAPAAAFAYELAARATGAETRSREDLLERLPSDGARPAFAERLPLRRLLTPGEQKTLERIFGTAPPPPPSAATTAAFLEVVRAPDKSEGTLRLASGLPAGLAGDVVRASKCRPPDGAAAAARVKYRADGRPESVSLLTAPPARECQDAAAALFAASIAPSWRLPAVEASDVLIAKLDEDALACQDEPRNVAREPRAPGGVVTRVGSRIKEPKKVRNVPPIYPDAAKRERVQGVVLLDATLSPSGCVREVRVLSGHTMLSAAALAAVAGWRYTPTLLDGVAVPVVMTVTVNFRLN